MVNYMLSKGGRIALFLGEGCQVIGGCCSKLTGKKESASSFCFANSFSSSSSMSKGTAPVLRRAAELSPPRPPPRPPRPPLDMMFVCMCVLYMRVSSWWCCSVTGRLVKRRVSGCYRRNTGLAR